MSNEVLIYTKTETFTKNEFVSNGLAKKCLQGEPFRYDIFKDNLIHCQMTSFEYMGANREELYDIFEKGSYEILQCNCKTNIFEVQPKSTDGTFFNQKLDSENPQKLVVIISLLISENKGPAKKYQIIMSGMSDRNLVPYESPHAFLE